MKLQLKAKHFKHTGFLYSTECPIARALQELFPGRIIEEHVHRVLVGDRWYSHEDYGCEQYLQDNGLAMRERYSDKVIRNIDIPDLMPPKLSVLQSILRWLKIS